MPSITDIFGANATVITSDTTVTATSLEPVLIIKASDLETWNDRTQVQNPNKWVTAILRKAMSYFAADNRLNDGTMSMTVAPTYLSLADRDVGGSTVTKTWYQIGVNLYTSFTGPLYPDPDDVA
jgi:hypothetical protein